MQEDRKSNDPRPEQVPTALTENRNGQAPLAGVSAGRRLLSVPMVVSAILCSMYFIMYLDRVNISLTAKEMMREFSLSNTEIGVAFSAFAWPYLFGQLAGGWLAKQWGAKATLTVCCLIVGLSTVYTGFVAGLISLFAARLALGIGEGPSFSAATTAMRNWFPEKRFGFIQGITHSASRLGGAVAPPLVAWLVVAGGWRVSFMACGLMSLFWVGLWCFYFTDDPRKHAGMTQKELEALPAACTTTRHSRTPFWALAKRIGTVTAVDFCYGWTLWVFISWIPLYFQNKCHLDLKSSALLSCFTFGAGVVGDTLGGLTSDWLWVRTGNKRIARNLFIAFALVAAGLMLWCTVVTTNVTLITIFLGLAFFFLELIVGTIWAIPMDISCEFAGLASGMMNFGFGLAGIVSPIVFGVIIDKTHNWDIPFACTVGICLVGAGLTYFMRPDIPFINPYEETSGSGEL